MAKHEVDSSSSDDETLTEALREACDGQFLPQSLFDAKNSSNSGPESKIKEIKPSLRVAERTDDFWSFGVSQAFKDHVAKKLDALLERSIVHRAVDDSGVLRSSKKKKRSRSSRIAGVKLLGSSARVISELEESAASDPPRRAKRRNRTGDVDPANLAKCREVAVDGNWVLSKKETKSWSDVRKGAVFKYKKGCDGVSLEQQ